MDNKLSNNLLDEAANDSLETAKSFDKYELLSNHIFNSSNKEKKNYVLDTNILLSSPNSIFGFEDNNIWITGTTLQELDSKKTIPGELGFNARSVIRTIEHCREKGDLLKGIPLDNGGTLLVEPNGINKGYLPEGFSLDIPDNRIISSILHLMHTKPTNERFILVTNDVSMRINASICGVTVESYRNDHISTDEKYIGKDELEVSSDIINTLYAEKEYILDEDMLNKNKFIENEFFILKSVNSSALAIYREKKFKLISDKKVYGVTPKNASQKFALYALTAPVEEIPFVILKGEAGSAKTFLSLAAGLDQLNVGENNYKSRKSAYDKVMITRNNVTSDAEFGFLPGDIDDKMTPLLAPFYDNLESLIRGKNEDESNEQIQMQIDDLFDTGLIKVCPLAYMRGRSITRSYLIVDEAQNSSKSQMRDIITRAGKGTKIIICGDPKQIDNHILDKYNNGLVFAAERMKGSPLCAQITFSEKESVRSELASEAIRRLEI